MTNTPAFTRSSKRLTRISWHVNSATLPVIFTNTPVRPTTVYTLVEATVMNLLERQFSNSGGYLYEYDSPTDYRFEYLGADPALYSPRFFDPKTHESDPDPAPLVAWIKAMNTATDTNFAST